MGALALLADGISRATSNELLIATFIGVVVGLIVGVLPGIGPAGAYLTFFFIQSSMNSMMTPLFFSSSIIMWPSPLMPAC